jgi:hypothetical protein
MNVRLNGRLNWYMTYSSQSSTNTSAGNKNGSVHNTSYIRLYPGMDAIAANGLKYGVAAEIRQDNGNAAQNGATGATAGRDSLYWRRAYGYVGSDKFGKIQVGMGDGPVSSFATGQMYELGDANFCGDTWGITAGINGAAPYPFVACTGSMYAPTKIAYYSPQFAGFDFGFAWEPDQGTGGDTSGCQSGLNGCNSQAVGTTPGDWARRRNLIDVALRYRGSFNGVGLAAAGGYVHAGNVNAPGGYSSYDDLSFGWGGVKLTYMGFSLQGAIQGGQQNRDSTPLRGAPDQFTWQIGTSYTNGPLQIGVSYFETTDAGSWCSASANSDGVCSVTGPDTKRKDRGVYTAINYGIAPGLSALVAYAWGESKQKGYDLNKYASGMQEKVDGQMITGGLVFRW